MIVTEPADTALVPSCVRGERGTRFVIILRAPGCVYDRRPSGGCTYCSFRSLTSAGIRVSPDDLVQQVESAAARVDFQNENVLQVEIFNSGNFLNEFEVPTVARIAIFEKIVQWETVRVAVIESRPEYIVDANLLPLRNILAQTSGKRLEIGIGLESVTDSIREDILRKGFGRADFERSVAILSTLDIDLLAYVMLKPAAMPDGEAVAESIRTARYVFEVAARHGVRARVALQPTFVVPGTQLAADYLEGRYCPPTMEMTYRTARAIAELGEVHVGLWDEGLRPLAVPIACEACRSAFSSALIDFNLTQDVTFLSRDLRCCTHCFSTLAATHLP